MKSSTWAEYPCTQQNTSWSRFVTRHPHWSYIILLLGMPLGLISGVSAAACAILLPLSYLLGWL